MEFITGYSTVVIELNSWLLREKNFQNCDFLIWFIDGGRLENIKYIYDLPSLLVFLVEMVELAKSLA